MKKNVMIIVAHPDDEVLGCGGFINKYKKKFNFKVIFLAEGSSCKYVNLVKNEKKIEFDAVKNKKKIEQEILVRKNCAKKASKILGVKAINFYDNKCGSLSYIPQLGLNKIVEKEIENFKPSIVLTHSGDDLNMDHRAIFNSVLTSTRPINYKSVEELYSFEILSSTEWNYEKNFKPNVFVELSEKDIINKSKALNCYKSEVKSAPYPRSRYGLKALAKYRGLQSGFMYAESFRLIRKITK